MPIAPLMQRFVDDELARCAELIARTQAGTLQLLRDGSGLGSSERALQAELSEALQRQGGAFQAEFVQALRSRVADELNDAQRAAAAPEPAGLGALDGLELMDESRVESDIEISRATQLIDTTAEWELRELQTFTSTLSGQTHVSAESNPLRPLVYASALWQATGIVTSDSARRALLLRTAAGVMAGLLKNAWAAACTRLESQGVEPGIYRTVLLTPANVVPRTPDFDVTRPGAFGALLAGMPVARAADASGAATELRIGLVTPSFGLPGGALQGSGVTGSGMRERQVAELLSRLFARIQTDTQVPSAFRAVLARLQVSALGVALKDPALLDSHEHPVWQLMDRIGQAASAWPQPGDPRAARLLAFCDAAAEQVAQAGEPDAALFKRALTRVDAQLAEQLAAEQQAAQPAIHTLMLAERRELLEQTLSQRLVDQMVPVRTSPGVRRFVTGALARVVAESMLRFGEQADVTRTHLRTVDDLLWSLQIPDHPQSRQRLLTLLPTLLQRLRAGMALIALPAAEQQVVLDELMTIHTEALRPGTRGGAATLTPEEIVQRMRDEVLPPTTGHGAFSDSVIDLSSMETVPAEMLPTQNLDDEADDPAKRVEALRAADTLRLFLRGRWTRVQLLWRSDRSLYFLFADEVPGRTHSVTRRALERLGSAGLMRPLEDKTLVQRATDSLMRELSLNA
jgi:Protein of unknown function (DUF1631)